MPGSHHNTHHHHHHNHHDGHHHHNHHNEYYPPHHHHHHHNNSGINTAAAVIGGVAVGAALSSNHAGLYNDNYNYSAPNRGGRIAGFIFVMLLLFVVLPLLFVVSDGGASSYAVASSAGMSSMAISSTTAAATGTAFFASATGIGLLVALGIGFVGSVYYGARQAAQNGNKSAFDITLDNIMGRGEALSFKRGLKQFASLVFSPGIFLGAGGVRVYQAVVSGKQGAKGNEGSVGVVSESNDVSSSSSVLSRLSNGKSVSSNSKAVNAENNSCYQSIFAVFTGWGSKASDNENSMQPLDSSFQNT